MRLHMYVSVYVYMVLTIEHRGVCTFTLHACVCCMHVQLTLLHPHLSRRREVLLQQLEVARLTGAVRSDAVLRPRDETRLVLQRMT